MTFPCSSTAGPSRQYSICLQWHTLSYETQHSSLNESHLAINLDACHEPESIQC